jgi:hypothetical protein
MMNNEMKFCAVSPVNLLSIFGLAAHGAEKILDLNGQYGVPSKCTPEV